MSPKKQVLYFYIGTFILLCFSCRKADLSTAALSKEDGMKSIGTEFISGTPKQINGVHGILTDDDRFEMAQIVETSSGALLGILSNTFENPAKTTIHKVYSYDYGQTWTTPQDIYLPNPHNYKFTACNLFRVNSRLFLIMNQVAKVQDVTHEGGIPAISFSDDEGATWSTPQKMLAGLEREIVVMGARNVTRTNTGRLLVPFHYGQRGSDPNRLQVNILYSDDQGVSWSEGPNKFGYGNSEQSIEAGAFAEPSIGQLTDGRLIMFFRTRLGFIYKCYSTDDGITWSTPVSTNLQSPWTMNTIFFTPQGYIVMAYTNAAPLAAPDEGYPRNNLKFAISYDDGGRMPARLT